MKSGFDAFFLIVMLCCCSCTGVTWNLDEESGTFSFPVTTVEVWEGCFEILFSSVVLGLDESCGSLGDYILFTRNLELVSLNPKASGLNSYSKGVLGVTSVLVLSPFMILVDYTDVLST